MPEPRLSTKNLALAELFGLGWDELGQIHELNHVFELSAYRAVVAALKMSEQNGKGVLATFKLRTVENKHWGIAQGQEVYITFVYQVQNGYKKQIPQKWMEELQEAVTETAQSKRKLNFKTPPLIPWLYNRDQYRRAWLTAHMMTWIVLNNQEHFSFDTEEVNKIAIDLTGTEWKSIAGLPTTEEWMESVTRLTMQHGQKEANVNDPT